MITRAMIYQNMHRLVVERCEDDSGYLWRVSELEGCPPDYYVLGAGKRLTLEDALTVGREELAVWSGQIEAV